MTERSYAGPISKVERLISDRFCAILSYSVNTDPFGPSPKYISWSED